MVSITSEYGLYLYTGKVDMRKGIDGLCGIISEQMGHNPRKPKRFVQWQKPAGEEGAHQGIQPL